MVFNRKPNYKRAPVGIREIAEEQVEEQEVTDEVDDGFIHEAVSQEASERRAQRLLASEGLQRLPTAQDQEDEAIAEDLQMEDGHQET